MSELAALPPVIREALAAHELLRRTGIRAEAIILEFVGGDLVISFPNGGRLFRIRAGEAPPDFRPSMWVRACELFNSAPEAELQALWDASAAKAHGFGLVAAILRSRTTEAEA